METTDMDSKTTSAIDVVDLDLYPIHLPQSEIYQSRISAARKSLESEGCCVLKGFIRPEALGQIAVEPAAHSPKAHFTGARATVYGGPLDPAYPADHPRNMVVQRDNGFVAGDFIGGETAIRRLYHAKEIRDFVGRCLGADEIFEFADPLA